MINDTNLPDQLEMAAEGTSIIAVSNLLRTAAATLRIQSAKLANQQEYIRELEEDLNRG